MNAKQRRIYKKMLVKNMLNLAKLMEDVAAGKVNQDEIITKADLLQIAKELRDIK